MDDARSAAVKHYDSDLKKLAKRLHLRMGGSVDVEDLEQFGRLGIARALDRYQPDLGPRDPWVLKQAAWAMRSGARSERRQRRFQRLAAMMPVASENVGVRLERRSRADSEILAFLLSEVTRLKESRSPEDEYCTEQARTQLPIVIAKLPDDRPRQAIEILCAKKMTTGELAQAWGISKSRVSHIFAEGMEQAKALVDSPPPVPEL